MSKIVKDFQSGRYVCECGLEVHLWFNGGELDRVECKCGREYATHATGYYLEIKDPAHPAPSKKGKK